MLKTSYTDPKVPAKTVASDKPEKSLGNKILGLFSQKDKYVEVVGSHPTQYGTFSLGETKTNNDSAKSDNLTSLHS